MPARPDVRPPRLRHSEANGVADLARGNFVVPDKPRPHGKARADGRYVRLRIRIHRQTIDGRVPDVVGGEDGATAEGLASGVWASRANQCESYNCKKRSTFHAASLESSTFECVVHQRFPIAY